LGTGEIRKLGPSFGGCGSARGSLRKFLLHHAMAKLVASGFSPRHGVAA
jgi:hypothetical protein